MINNYLMTAMLMAIVESVMNTNTQESNPLTDLINAIGENAMAEGRETTKQEQEMMHFGGIALGQMMEQKQKTPTMDEAMAGAMLMQMLSKWGK